MRFISHSQATAVLDCQVQYDARYVGTLFGGEPLKARTPHLKLRGGRAWGAGIQTYHQHGSVTAAVTAMREAIIADCDEIAEQGGAISDEETDELAGRVAAVMAHYASEYHQLGLTAVEVPLLVVATRGYRYEAYLDGVIGDGAWLYESKFRGKLSSIDQVYRSRQPWWYGWAYQRQTGVTPNGIMVEETLDEPPAPVRYNKDGSASAVQSCTLADYEAACRRTNTEPSERTLDALRAKRFNQRIEIAYTKRGLEMAGKQIRSAAQLIGLFDRKVLTPIHNPSQMRCGGCAFKEVCVDPSDEGVIDALFTRVAPARTRTEARHK